MRDPISDKSPAIIVMLAVLVLVYFSNAGKLGAIKRIIKGPANPDAVSAGSTAPAGPPPAGSDPAPGGGTPPLTGPIGGGGK